jgi:hypothetical protein
VERENVENGVVDPLWTPYARGRLGAARGTCGCVCVCMRVRGAWGVTRDAGAKRADPSLGGARVGSVSRFKGCPFAAEPV